MSKLVLYKNEKYVPYYKGQQYTGDNTELGIVSFQFVYNNEILKNTYININGSDTLTNDQGIVTFKDKVNKVIELFVIYKDCYQTVKVTTKKPPYLDIVVNINQLMMGTITYEWTYSHIEYITFTVPWYANVIEVKFTWNYKSDEKSRLSKYQIGDGCGIANTDNNKMWYKYDTHGYVAVTPGKTYNLAVWVDGYQSRDYGFILSWGTEINKNTTNIEDR